MNFESKQIFARWENENREQFLKLLQGVLLFSKQSALRIAKISSFALYLAYAAGRILWICARCLFVGPELIQRVAPGERPLERHEFERKDLNQFPSLWLK